MQLLLLNLISKNEDFFSAIPTTRKHKVRKIKQIQLKVEKKNHNNNILYINNTKSPHCQKLPGRISNFPFFWKFFYILFSEVSCIKSLFFRPHNLKIDRWHYEQDIPKIFWKDSKISGSSNAFSYSSYSAQIGNLDLIPPGPFEFEPDLSPLLQEIELLAILHFTLIL